MFLSSLLFLVLSHLSIAVGSPPRELFRATAWQGTATFPEETVPHLRPRPSTGVAFSGGGSRSYAATLGQLAALHQLGLLQSTVRYIAGLSGSAWALVPLLFATKDRDVGELLGLPIVAPSDLTKEKLAEMNPRCARSFAQPSVLSTFETCLKARGAFADPLSAVAHAWTDTVQQLFLDPVGIPRGALFSVDAATVAAIKQRNPALMNATFLVPGDRWPFLIVGATMVGPVAYGPYGPEEHHNYTRFEFTPQYVGQLHARDVTYPARWPTTPSERGPLGTTVGCSPHTVLVGGAVEPFAFEAAYVGLPGWNRRTAGAPAHGGLPPGAATGVLPDVPAPTTPLDLATVLSASSFFPGGFVESFPLLDIGLGLCFPYWSPASTLPPEEHATFFSDGGTVENAPLLSLLQRRVQRVVVFLNNAEPVLPASRWNVTADPPRGQTPEDFSSYFGVYAEGGGEVTKRSWDYRHNQVFASSDYQAVARSLQRALQPPSSSPSPAALGTGTIARASLTTVENTHWGVPAGLAVDVTFVLLGRIEAWEAQLPPDIRSAAVPPGDDVSQTVADGPFASFPFYPTGLASLSAEKTNLLANMVGWSVLANAQLFRDVLGPT